MISILTWAFLLGGSFFAVVGGIGIVRLPEFFSRLHGGGITDTLGAGLIIAGLLFQEPLNFLVTAKLLMILFFLMVTSPTSCHALARSAMTQGFKPVLEVDTLDTNKN
ncbi:MAG: monovalent cation/H(+) antiporter subunit G [Mariniblastus sp.]|nr:monovalent cation/H(+) antiporter subunit G [Mariniblastus sp.]